MKHLFICALGPVQDFIATARRSRDLWFGSWILSELSKTAAMKVVEFYPDSLVFPAPDLLNSIHNINVPNKIVAIIEGNPRTLGRGVRDAVFEKIEKLGDDALDALKNQINWALAAEQIKDLPEFYWVSVGYESDDEYSKARDQAEALLAARKVTRDFKQMLGSNASKSSLDGARESVIPGSAYPERNVSAKVRQEKIQNLYHHYRARRGEQLSGVDLLKRIGQRKDEPDFPSTSDMAAVPFLQRVVREKGKDKDKELLVRINSLLKDHGWDVGEVDGSLVFESRLTEWIPAEDIPDTLRQQFTETLKAYAGELKPNPYYTLLAADGDNMGLIIDAQKDLDTHRELSKALSQFAAEVPGIVTESHGRSIYSGGDDVLAYLPLHTALGCAGQLEETFREKLGKFTAQKDGETITPTLSIGIVIAHHLEPLSDVLELAREAEKVAKMVDGKNGFAITLNKRGGAARTISGKWSIFDKRLSQLISYSRGDEISAGTAYELQELHRILSPAGIPARGMAEEALRIVARKKETGGAKAISKEVRDTFEKWLLTDEISPGDLAKEMIIAGIFADAESMLDEHLQATQEVSA